MPCQVRWPTIVAAAGRFGMGVRGQMCNHHHPPGFTSCLSAYLTRRVDYFCQKILPAVFDRFAECVLDGGIIALDKYTLHKSHRQ